MSVLSGPTLLGSSVVPGCRVEVMKRVKDDKEVRLAAAVVNVTMVGATVDALAAMVSVVSSASVLLPDNTIPNRHIISMSTGGKKGEKRREGGRKGGKE